MMLCALCCVRRCKIVYGQIRLTFQISFFSRLIYRKKSKNFSIHLIDFDKKKFLSRLNLAGVILGWRLSTFHFAAVPGGLCALFFASICFTKR